jgi:transposase InsO family protein
VLTPAARREAVRRLQGRFGVSERRACRVVGQPRATQQRRPARRAGEARLTERILHLVGVHPRFGCRRIWALLVREGWRVNRKRVHRLWRRLGLKVPRRQRKKRRLGHGGNGCARRRAEGQDHVWAWDFIHDRTADGQALKWLSVVDEYTRECLVLEARRRLAARAVVGLIAAAARRWGVPEHIRSDSGPEFIARAIRKWLSGASVAALYSEPWAPWENGYAESSHSRLRDELLDREEFGSVLEARVLAAEWREAYNRTRPHGSLGDRTPEEFAASCPRADSSKPAPARGHKGIG